MMKKAIKALRKTIPEIVSVFVLLFINVYLFALIGMLLFPRYYRIDNTPRNNTNASLLILFKSTNETQHFEQNKSFGSLYSTIINLIILVTTSNNPDVMEQAYSRHRLSSLYFVLYLIIGYYCITSLVTAVIYNKFKGFFRDSIVSSAFRQSVGIRASFWILHSKFEIPENPGFLPKSAVEIIIENLSISLHRKKLLTQHLKNISYCIQISPDISSYIELEQYEKLFLDNFSGIIEEENDFTCAPKIPKYQLSAALDANMYLKIKLNCCRLLAIMFENRFYLIFNCLLTIVNIACVSAELEVLKNPYHKIDEIHRDLSVSWKHFK